MLFFPEQLWKLPCCLKGLSSLCRVLQHIYSAQPIGCATVGVRNHFLLWKLGLLSGEPLQGFRSPLELEVT